MLHTATPYEIRRADYTPPSFFIDAVTLEFDLKAEKTLVSNRMQIRRNPAAPRSASLRLDGQDLELISVLLNGIPYSRVMADAHSLEVREVPDQFELTVLNACQPINNTSLMGLYVSNGNFFTQCEAEGFRRITYFLDRPDVMARYRVTLRADKGNYPVLLSNGNLIAQGELPGGGHYATWEDPFPKPCYLFALVAGKLAVLEEQFVARSGKSKLLQVWVEPQDLDKTRHAMDSLVHALQWDEQRFGLELDLERFMVVAVSDFNMGAMENKGLNIFNTRYVLASPETATDADYANIESVVGHEYFHNWTGNRVTCRDWFQLSLKEGLTVFRDQEFSADMACRGVAAHSADSYRATQRIEDVRNLRQIQFAEDSGPMAHPVRPESYVEINNFYTSTVYEKGAEVVRMYQTLLGREGFQRGMDLYFERHDGTAATCDDFRQAMADANQCDLTQFERWYDQAGTPHVRVSANYDANEQTLTLHLSQQLPGNSHAQPMLIPFAVGLIGPDGHDLPLQLTGESATSSTTRVLAFNQREQSFTFTGIAAKPLPSLLRNFSAPVIVDYPYSFADLVFLLTYDSDPFNRWEAGQRLATRELLALAQAAAAGKTLQLDETVIDAFGQVLRDESLSPAFRAHVLTLPSETYLAEQMAEADPAAVHNAWLFFRQQLASKLRNDWLTIYQTHHQTSSSYDPSAVNAGRRALKNLALSYLSELDDASASEYADAQYRRASNMTDRAAALSVLLQRGGTLAAQALADFYRTFEQEPLVIDKWFALQATRRGAPGERVLDSVRELMQHPAFTLRNPNRARALIASFCAGNPAQFHRVDGSGYAFWAEQVIAIDQFNPQVAARLARILERWRKFIPALREPMRVALERVKSHAQSKDVLEIVEKTLA